MGQIFSDEAPVTSVYNALYAMQPLYTSVTMKKMTPSLSETTVTSVDNVF